MGDGCWIGNRYFGAVGYADDLVLLSPTVHGLRSMLGTCERFGELYSVQYNPKKTVCALFSRRKVENKPLIKLCGSEIKWVETFKHLGNIIAENLSEEPDVKHKKGDLIQRVNSVLSTLDGSSDEILRTVFNSQCSHLYGTSIWNFHDKSMKMFEVVWNRSVRRLFKLPHMTHTRYLPCFTETPRVRNQIFIRFINMCKSFYSSQNERVRFLFELCHSNARSIIGGNLSLIAQNLNIRVGEVMGAGVGLLKDQQLSQEDERALALIMELRNDCIPGFTQDEIGFIQTFVCNDVI